VTRLQFDKDKRTKGKEFLKFPTYIKRMQFIHAIPSFTSHPETTLSSTAF
jgi:hypothetical protein